MLLEKIRFKGIQKTNLRIIGNDPGKGILRGNVVNGNLTASGIYDTGTFRLPNGTERMPLGRNVPQIYEAKLFLILIEIEMEILNLLFLLQKKILGIFALCYIVLKEKKKLFLI